MTYPEFKMSHGVDELTVEALNIVSWKRELIESDEGVVYKYRSYPND